MAEELRSMVQSEKQAISHIVAPYFVDLSCDMHGTFVLQELIEAIDDSTREMFLQRLMQETGGAHRVIECRNGNYVMKALLQYTSIDILRREFVPFVINQVIKDNIKALTMGKKAQFSHRTLIWLLERCRESNLDIVEPMLCEVADCCELLLDEQYGTMVLNAVLQHAPPRHKVPIITAVQNEIGNTAFESNKHWYAGFVVSQCFKILQEEDPTFEKQRQALLDTVLQVRPESNTKCPLERMLRSTDVWFHNVASTIYEHCPDAQERMEFLFPDEAVLIEILKRKADTRTFEASLL